jgi:hypothetical protein
MEVKRQVKNALTVTVGKSGKQEQGQPEKGLFNALCVEIVATGSANRQFYQPNQAILVHVKYAYPKVVRKIWQLQQKPKLLREK